VPGLPNGAIVAKVYGGGAEVLEPNWLARPCLSSSSASSRYFWASLFNQLRLVLSRNHGDARPNLSLTKFGNTMQRWRVMTRRERV
jgi:hypothetical protein